MKKIAGLLIGDECDQQLLGLDEKHDCLLYTSRPAVENRFH